MEIYKQKIKKAALVYRRDTSSAEKAALKAKQILEKMRVETFSHPDQTIKGASKLKAAHDLDLVVVLGGDGTYLEAVRMLDGERVPVLGFNMGGLGFLTVTRVDDIESILKHAVAGRLEVRRRSMINIAVGSKGKSRDTFLALNDVVIERGGLSRLINIQMSVDKLDISAIKADGLIIATPTGSTAYNLAAGGPILHPEVQALVVTPICPHSLTSRPFIFPDNGKLRFMTSSQAVMTVDGVQAANLKKDDEVWVSRDECDHLFLRKPGFNYFNLLREKLKFGERA